MLGSTYRRPDVAMDQMRYLPPSRSSLPAGGHYPQGTCASHTAIPAIYMPTSLSSSESRVLTREEMMGTGHLLVDRVESVPSRPVVAASSSSFGLGSTATGLGGTSLSGTGILRAQACADRLRALAPEGPNLFPSSHHPSASWEPTREAARVSYTMGVRGATTVPEVHPLHASDVVEVQGLPTIRASTSSDHVQAQQASPRAQDSPDLHGRLARELAARARLQAQLAALEAESQDARSALHSNSELKVELVCASRVRDTLQADLLDENAAAAKLRHQLTSAEVVAGAARGAAARGQEFSAEIRSLRGRTAELEVELSRSLRVQDKIQTDLAVEATATAQLRQQLAVAEAKSRRSLTLAQAAPRQVPPVANGGGRYASPVSPASPASPPLGQGRADDVEMVVQDAIAKQNRLKQRLRDELSANAELRQCAVSAEEQAAASATWLCQKLSAAEDQAQVSQAQAARNAAAERFRNRGQKPQEDREAADQELQNEVAVVKRLREQLSQAEAQAARAPEPSAKPLDNSILRGLAWEGPEVSSGSASNGGASMSSYRSPVSREAMQSLFEAAAGDDLEALRGALPAGEDAVATVLSARDVSGRTLLQAALAAGSLECARFFLEEGKRRAERRRYLHEVQAEMLERELGQFVNGCDSDGCAALALFCQRAETSSAETSRALAVMLLEASADPIQRDKTGMTPFLECVKAGNCEMMMLLLKGTRGYVLRDLDDHQRSALHWAAKEGQVETVELLLKAGGDADALDADAHTAADVARAAGHSQLAGTLAEALSDEALEGFLARGSGSEEGDGSEEIVFDIDEIPPDDHVTRTIYL
mmetsp:Transcript_16923/g.54748  ORF Transcript_16923/g.54748 Transcript_16923/m.54748 type:complete len:826 (-) Transcript_16923:126-2603(-)